MSDDDFFGRPRAAGPVRATPRPTRPAPQPAPARRRSPAPRPTNRRGPRPAAAAPRRTPGTSPFAAPRTRRSGPPAPPALRARTSRASRPPGGGAPSRRRIQRRLSAMVVMSVFAVVGITARLVDLQVTGRAHLVAYGLSQRDGERTIPAGRGAIYDRDGRAFALSAPEGQVVANPKQVTDPKATAKALAEVLDVDADGLAAKLKLDSSYKVLAPTVSDDVADEVAELKLPGIAIEEQYPRSNPSGTLASSVVGRALPDGQVDAEGADGHQGLSGLERQYDRQLTGHPGQLSYDSDRWGNTLAGGRHELEAAVPGTDLYLTLDQSLQYETEKALAAQVTATGATSAMAVIMRPSTGEVLSMASQGVLDDGTVGNTRDNKPVTTTFEPGSVNKMITISAALEEGEVSPDTVLQVPDSLTLYDRTFTDHDPHPQVGWSTTDILVTSSNIGTIMIAQQLGEAKVDEYLRRFGFGASTGLGFPAEEDGIYRPVDEWSPVDLGSVPIGQGISVTALQMLSAYNAIANDGVYVAPKLVAATDRGDGEVATPPSAHHRVVSADTAAAMRAMLAGVVTDGTGKLAAVPGYEVAGKTGTARIKQEGGGDEEDGYVDANGRRHYWSTFVGLVNGADLSVIVAVEDAQTSIFGGDVAAPVFSDLASRALARYRIPPPALVAASRHGVPELSTTARDAAADEDVIGGTPAAAG